MTEIDKAFADAMERKDSTPPDDECPPTQRNSAPVAAVDPAVEESSD